MKIFDANISGSLNVSGAARFFGDLTVDGTINAAISGTSTNALSLNTTGSARFATTGSNTFNANQTISGSLYVTTDVVINGTSYTAATSGSSGSSGTSGSSGSSGTSGSSGSNGSSGTSGSSGSSGTSGSSGSNGSSGTSITTSGTNNKVVKFTSTSTVGDSSISDDGTTVTIGGNLVVSGTQTTINSTTLAIGDNIIQLNGTGAANAGLVVRDATAGTLTSGSLLWDTTNDKWIAGPLGSEDDVVLKTGTQTLTNKTISGASNTLTNIANGSLTNSSVTVTAGTGMSGGGAVALGSSVTLTNAGVTSAVAGTGVSVSAGTGAVTFSIGQAVGTGASVQFANGYITTGLGVGTAAPATVGLIRATNDVIAYYVSDERLKENFENITNPLEKLKQINGYSYDWIPMAGVHENEGHDIGVKAQEIESVLPEIVTTRENGYKAVKYDRIVALLIETNKELLNRIEALEAKIK